ncbi:MAG: pyridoxal-phosphate dependent enzyme, partial [Proteobacteria bacterium]
FSNRFKAVPPPLHATQTLPDFKIEPLNCGLTPIWVVREDILEGGTKQRACLPYLKACHDSGARVFVYASPFAGFAQVALAVTARTLGIPVTLFCEKDATKPGKRVFHEFSELARGYRARIELCDSLSEATERTSEYASQDSERLALPLGFDCPIFKKFLKQEITRGWEKILQVTDQEPATVWLPVGSGTLLKTFSQVIPQHVNIRGVNVRVLSDSDSRMIELAGINRCQIDPTPETFAEHSVVMPPIPSNIHYDAKLWQFMQRSAKPGDLWWNVAR